MHRSKIGATLVDIPAEVYDREVDFWAAAIGRPPIVDPSDPDYADFGQPVPGFGFMVQRVGAPARLHLDIEADDIDAEVARLEALGAERVEAIQTWWVLRDPAGLLFCVIAVQDRTAFDAHATTWP